MRGLGKKFIDTTSDYINNIGNQDVSAPKQLNAKTIPINDVCPDPNNPRRMHIDQPEIQASDAPNFRDFLPFNDQNQQAFEKAYQAYCQRFDQPEIIYNEFYNIATLAASIVKKKTDNILDIKLIQPIVVEMNQNKFDVRAGHRRRLAFLLLRIDEIPAIIEADRQNEEEIILLQYKENKAREDISLSEETNSLIRLNNTHETMYGKQLSIRSLCELTGMRRTRASNILAVVKLAIGSQIFLDALEQEKITSLKVACDLARLENVKLRDELIEEFLASDGKLSFDQAIKRIKQKGKKKPPTSPKIMHPTSNDDIALVGKLIKVLKQDKELDKALQGIDIGSKKSAQEAWQIVIDLLKHR